MVNSLSFEIMVDSSRSLTHDFNARRLRSRID